MGSFILGKGKEPGLGGYLSALGKSFPSQGSPGHRLSSAPLFTVELMVRYWQEANFLSFS